ncbi:hypothetical protein BOW53_13615 [Solemya pervernicosa gill symbiont]|uniref:CHAD domain-containing protein n=2 Tax=Gammaproteobacteria incertae sedis TaxID=118884 RepID=A0A1T2L1F3_9GAMM|nr:hypothetical protein BOW53_13615 [Solemya pervernicosa gill symbiont]
MTLYPLPVKESTTRWRTRLLELLPLQAEQRTRSEIHFYDTFDWRLYRANQSLQWLEGENDARLILCERQRGAPRSSIPQSTPPPRFANELEASALQRELTSRQGLRAFLPLVTVERYCHPFKQIDKEGKTRLRVTLEEQRICLGNTSKRLTLQLVVTPLRGYERAAKQCVKVLEQQLKLTAGDNRTLQLALAAVGTEPNHQSSRLNFELDPSMRSDTAYRTVLLNLLETMIRNEPGTIENLDSEFLHDFRVAIRRSRSLLGQAKHILPPHSLARFKQEFSWLGSITSPTRDLDVYLLMFDSYRQRLPKRLRADLEPLHTFLQRHHQSEQSTLAIHLSSARYRNFKQQWLRFLNSAPAKRPVAKQALKPISLSAHQHTWKIYQRVMREGAAITPQSPADDLHELRKSCKKLRYLMEFFQSIYSAKAIKHQIKELKRLQDNLGDFQDLEVQIHTLQRFGLEMPEELQVEQRHLDAIDRLLSILEGEMHAVRTRFEHCFRRFADQKNQQRFSQLFHSDGPAAQ